MCTKMYIQFLLEIHKYESISFYLKKITIEFILLLKIIQEEISFTFLPEFSVHRFFLLFITRGDPCGEQHGKGGSPRVAIRKEKPNSDEKKKTMSPCSMT